MAGWIFQLNVSAGGVPKLPVRDAVVTEVGLVGDVQKHLNIHGGPERALCLFSLETIVQLQSEGHPILAGAVGENVTLGGLDWAQVLPGCQLALGPEVVVQITRYTAPCNTIRFSFAGGDFTRISQDYHPGQSRVYARVLRPGNLVVGQPVQILDQ
jgi:MOSC domain-containing protein YiiM